MGDAVAEPSALSEPERSERISGIKPVVQFHSVARDIPRSCDSTLCVTAHFSPFPDAQGVGAPTMVRVTLTVLDHHLQDRHRLEALVPDVIGLMAAWREGTNRARRSF
jgi:hypothetical protein